MNFRPRRARLYRQVGRRDNRTLKQAFFEQGFESQLQLVTINKYWSWVRRLIHSHVPPIHPDQLSDEAVIKFIVSIRESGLSESSTKQAIDSMRFLYRKVVTTRRALENHLTRLRGETHEKTPSPERALARLARTLMEMLGRLKK